MRRILLTGKGGQLGWELQHALEPLGDVAALGRAELDLSNENDIRRVLRDCAPEIIVNAAGYTNVDKAESEPDVAHQINAVAPRIMAEVARRTGALLVHYSTDYVFDGTKGAPYVEEDTANPVNVYGKSKLDGERAVVAAGCRHLILRASWIYSSRGSNFVLTMLRLARKKRHLLVVEDQVGSPSWARSLATASAEILARIPPSDGSPGIFHLSAWDYATRLDFARAIIDLAKCAAPDAAWGEIHPTTTANYPLPAQRPLNAATSKAKVKQRFGVQMPAWRAQLASFMQSTLVDDR